MSQTNDGTTTYIHTSTLSGELMPGSLERQLIKNYVSPRTRHDHDKENLLIEESFTEQIFQKSGLVQPLPSRSV